MLKSNLAKRISCLSLTGSHYVVHAGLYLLGSSEPLASISQVAGLTDTHHHAQTADENCNDTDYSRDSNCITQKAPFSLFGRTEIWFTLNFSCYLKNEVMLKDASIRKDTDLS